MYDTKINKIEDKQPNEQFRDLLDHYDPNKSLDDLFDELKGHFHAARKRLIEDNIKAANPDLETEKSTQNQQNQTSPVDVDYERAMRILK